MDASLTLLRSGKLPLAAPVPGPVQAAKRALEAGAGPKPRRHPDEVVYAWLHSLGCVSCDCCPDCAQFRVEPVDLEVVERRNPKVARLITGELTSTDRSRDMWLTMNTLHRLGYSVGAIYRAVWDSPVGEKARERGHDWFVGELERVCCELKP